MQVNQVRAGAILSYVSMAVSTILSLVYAPIMKGQLGTSEYGVYGSVGPIIAYLLLLSMGLGSAYMRYYSQAKVAQDRRTMAKLNGMFLVTYTVLGLVLLVLGFTLAAHPQNVFGAKWTEEELALGAELLRIMSVNAALSFPISVFESNVNINERYLFLKLVAMAKSVLSPMISIPLLLLGYHSPAIAILGLMLTIVSGVVEAFYCLIRWPSSGMGAGPCLGPFVIGHIALTCAEYSIIIFSPLHIVRLFTAIFIIKGRILFFKMLVYANLLFFRILCPRAA